MTAQQFIDRLKSEKSLHKLNKPATDDDIAAWEKLHPGLSPLPQQLREFYRLANGVTILKDKDALANVGGRLRIIGLKELAWAGTIMYGPEAEQDEALDIPRHWLGLGWDDNHDWSPVLDLKKGEVMIFHHIGGPSETLKSFEAFLGQVVEKILDARIKEKQAEKDAIKASPKPKRPPAKVAELTVVREVVNFSVPFNCLALSPDGKTAVTGSLNNNEHFGQPDAPTLHVWDVESLKVVRVLDTPHVPTSVSKQQADGRWTQEQVDRPPPIAAIAFSPDGRLITANVAATLKTFDAAAGRLLHEAQGAGGSNLRYSPDGKHLLTSGGYSDTVKLLDAATLTITTTLKRHNDTIGGAAYLPGGHGLVSYDREGHGRLWSLPAGTFEILPRLTTISCNIAVSPDGQWAAVAQFSRVTLIDLASRSLAAVFSGPKDHVPGIAFSPDGLHFAAIDDANVTRVWDVRAQKEVARYIGPTAAIHGSAVSGKAVAFLPDGKRLLTCGWDRALRLLKLPG